MTVRTTFAAAVPTRQTDNKGMNVASFYDVDDNGSVEVVDAKYELLTRGSYLMKQDATRLAIKPLEPGSRRRTTWRSCVTAASTAR